MISVPDILHGSGCFATGLDRFHCVLSLNIVFVLAVVVVITRSYYLFTNQAGPISHLSCSGVEMSLQQAVLRVWPPQPHEPPEAKVKRAAASALVRLSNYNTTSSNLAKMVKQSLGGSLVSMGISLQFKAVLQQHPNIFEFREGATAHEAIVALNPANLLRQAAAVQPQMGAAAPPPPPTPAPATAPAPAATGEAADVTLAEISTGVLQHINSMRWHSTDQLHVARRALAAHLVWAAELQHGQRAAAAVITESGAFSITGGQAGTIMIKAVQNTLGSAVQRSWGSIREALLDDPYLSTAIHGISELRVHLNMHKLLQHAEAALSSALVQAAGSSSGGGSRLAARVSTQAGAAAAGAAQQAVQQAAHVVLRGGADSSSISSSGPSIAGIAGSTGSPSAVSADALLQYVASRTWHPSDQQLNAARRALVKLLVVQANPDTSKPVVTTADAYTSTGAKAGQCMIQAVQQVFGADVQRSWSGTASALQGDAFLSTYFSRPSVQSVRLDIQRLLLHAAAAIGSSQVCSSSGIAASGRAVAGTSAAGSSAAAAVRVHGSPADARPAGIGFNAAGVALEAASTALQAAAKAEMDQELQPQPAQLAQPPPPPQRTPPPPPLRLTAIQVPSEPVQLLGLPLPESLKLLQGLSIADCAAAEVLVLEEANGSTGHAHTGTLQTWAIDQPELFMLVEHLSAAKLCALGMHTVATRMHQANSSLQHGSCHSQVALLQLFVPAAGGCDAWLYVIEVPQQKDAAMQLMRHLQPLLEDAAVIKVMQDARHGSVVLQQQHGIKLAGVLDTQLLAGLAALAGVLPKLSTQPDTAAVGSYGASSSASSSGASSSSASGSNGSAQHNAPGGHLGRISLAKLYGVFGCPDPFQAHNADPGIWFSRPLPAAALQSAAGSVRYLLPIAHALLQQLPGAAMAMAGLQMLLAQEGASALQLQLAAVPGYAPFLRLAGVPLPPNRTSGAGCFSFPASSSSSRSGRADTSEAAVQLSGLTSLQFELLLDTTSTPGWYLPQYVVYLNAQHTSTGQPLQPVQRPEEQQGQWQEQAQEEEQPQALVAPVVEPDTQDRSVEQGATLVGVSGSSAVLLPQTPSAGSSGSNGSSSSSTNAGGIRAGAASDAVGAETGPSADATTSATSSAGGSLPAPSAAAAAADGGVDEAVASLVQLLPDSLRPHLEQFLAPDCHPSLVEVCIDKDKSVMLRLSDRTTHLLPCKVRVMDALMLLHSARRTWQQQGRVAEDGQQQQQGPDATTGSAHSYAAADAYADIQGSVGTTGGDSIAGAGLSRTVSSSSTSTISSSSSLLNTLLETRSNCTQDAEQTAAAAVSDDKLAARAWSAPVPPPPAAAAAAAAAAPTPSKLRSMFGSDERLGVPGTLHRISAMRDRAGDIIGLTYRIGRHVSGVGRLLGDFAAAMKASLDPEAVVDRPLSLLVLGRPGTGKTTLLRDVAHMLSSTPSEGGLGLAVMIVDTSNEIAGDADAAHPCIGNSRRLMVPHREQQAAILVQAVQNHNPDVIIVDEIGTDKEVAAARTIAQRGVLLIGTAHGNSLSDLLRNPTLTPLVGGVKGVTLGDATAKESNNGSKTRLERAGAATFVSLLELTARNRWRLHMDVEASVDAMLASRPPGDQSDGVQGSSFAPHQHHHQQQRRLQVHTQLRSKGPGDRLVVQFESPGAAEQALRAAALVETAAAGSTSSTTARGGTDVHTAQSSAGGRAFSGGWLVDLLHAAVHKSITK